MFIRSLDEKELEAEEFGNASGETDESVIAFARYMDDGMFLIPTPQVLQKIVTGLDDLYEHDIAELDMQGDLLRQIAGSSSVTNV